MTIEHEMSPPPGASPTLPTLDGERVRLRPISAGDVPALFAVFGDAAVTRYWSTPALRNEAEASELLVQIDAKIRARFSFQWGIASRDDDALLGTCSIYRPDFEHLRSEIGFALGRVHWGRGYASEAIRLAIACAFDVLGLERLEADVDPRNDASLRALERLGFRREGYLRDRYRLNGEVQDSVILGLLRREWRAPRESRVAGATG
jgi:RimJ/RimL family protein N-acetyltransferase